MCWLGKNHPEGLLEPLDTEAVLAFQCNTDMMAMMHSITTAMVWGGEPIVLCILPPKGRQVREYIATRGSHPSGAQTHVQGRGDSIWPLPTVPSLGKWLLEAQASMPWVELTRDAQDLNSDQLQVAPEALQTEMAQRETYTPPVGSSGAITDDRDADPRQERGWWYGEPTQQPKSPPQSTLGVGQLLSMLMARLRMGTPCINTFSGDATLKKTEVSFEQWYHEVQCLKDHYPDAVV